jgi:polyphosphate kinase
MFERRIALENKDAFENREISWLKFNRRVLEEAENIRNPLFERLGFLSIFASNLDEFFMVRVGSLFERIKLDIKSGSQKSENILEGQTQEILQSVEEMIPYKDEAYTQILTELAKYNIDHISLEHLTQTEENYLKTYFEKEIAPIIAPAVINDKQVFPFIANKQLVIVCSVLGKSKKSKLAMIPVPTTLPGVVFLPDNSTIKFILLEQLICHFAHLAFHKYVIDDKAIVRITRNADIDENEALFDHDIDYREEMQELLQSRAKLSPVRIQYIGSAHSKAVNKIRKALLLKKRQVFREASPLDFSYISDLSGRLTAETKEKLFFAPLLPQKSSQINSTVPMIDQIKNKDLLLVYPFEDVEQFITLLNEAARDKRVRSIKMTLYRVAKNSKIIHALIEAARNGKEVFCNVELRASFDEENNIDWSKRLLDEGCTVIYGLPQFKVHAKLLLITYDDGGHQAFITQIGTGNYNEKTARFYTDISLMTADKGIAQDAFDVFEKLREGKFADNLQHLLVAPLCLKPRLEEMIDEEIAKSKQGKESYIFLKLNALSDRSLMEKLIEASIAGVKTDLVVRGICCLIAGVQGLTENITVRSIIGRFLEHSRIYMFGRGEESKIYIASADFMTRNINHRVEVAAPIYDKAVRQKILHIYDVIMSDNVKARLQNADGGFTAVNYDPGKTQVDSQLVFFKEAYENAKII